MQGGRGGGPGGRGPFNFNDPFAGLGGFGGFGGHENIMSNIFGGGNPFDDPFFTRPFGGMFESGFPGMGGGAAMFPGMGGGGGMFPRMGGGMFPGRQPSQFIENGDPETNNSRGVIIEELDSDHEEEGAGNEKRENPRKRGGPSNDPYVEHPDDAVEEKKSKHVVRRDRDNQFGTMQSQPQGHSFTFQSSSVTYGGANGAYYTKSKTRRMGSDGFAFEESKEADTSSGKATHKVSKGLHNKGHSITRNLETDGKVDTMRTLHNLNEDEQKGFEDAWVAAAQTHMPGFNNRLSLNENLGGSGSRHGEANGGGWALPSNERPQNPGNMITDAGKFEGSSHSRQPPNGASRSQRQ